VSSPDPIMVLQEQFGSQWDRLEPGIKAAMGVTMKDLSGLLAEAVAGHDVERELLLVRATIKAYESGAVSHLAGTFKRAAERYLRLVVSAVTWTVIQSVGEELSG